MDPAQPKNILSASEPPGSRNCDGEKEEPSLNDSSATEGEKENAGKPADIKHEKNGENIVDGFVFIDEETGAVEEHTTDSPSPPLSSVQAQNEAQLASSSWGGLWPTVNIFRFTNGQTFGADEAIMKKVKDNKNFCLTYLQSYLPISLLTYWLAPTIEEKQSPEESSVIIVFCPITSRVGSDVESVMTNPQVASVKKPIILVLMHHTRDPDYSTAGTKWSEEYENVVLDVHVFFHETVQGLLTCQQNDQAIEAIEKKLYVYITWPFVSTFLKWLNHNPTQDVPCRKETNV